MKVIEVYPGDGSVLVSQGPSAQFFQHIIPQEGKVNIVSSRRLTRLAHLSRRLTTRAYSIPMVWHSSSVKLLQGLHLRYTVYEVTCAIALSK